MTVIDYNLLEPNALPPKKQTKGSSGYDLHACITEELSLASGEHVLVNTGVSLRLPEEFEAQVRSRSGLACKHGVIVLNSPGTIDSDYRGEIKVILMNLSPRAFTIAPNMRIAQLVFAKVEAVSLQESSDIKEEETSRGAGGFGSTGK